MLTIWFIGMYVIFILQQIGLIIAVKTIEKLLYGSYNYKTGEMLKTGSQTSGFNGKKQRFKKNTR